MKTTLALLALFGVAIPAVSFAAETSTLSVGYADLNLETAEGQKSLDRRIDQAVREVCGYDEAPIGTRIVSHSVRACMTKAKASASERVSAIMRREARGG